MIWNNEILFVHVPKTAGMSMTDLLTDCLKRPVFNTGPVDKQLVQNGVTNLPGRRHETLPDAASFFTSRNMRLEDFEKIFAVMRNPYDLELSRYAYLRENLPQDKGKAQAIAMTHDFKDYLRKAPFFGRNPPRLDLYYQLNGSLPSNLVVLKFERLREDIHTYLKPYLEGNYELPHHNVSQHQDYLEVYDIEMEQLCFDRNRWFFEKGFYARLNSI